MQLETVTSDNPNSASTHKELAMLPWKEHSIMREVFVKASEGEPEEKLQSLVEKMKGKWAFQKKILLRGFSGIDKNSKVFTWRINREGGKLQPYDLKRVLPWKEHSIMREVFAKASNGEPEEKLQSLVEKMKGNWAFQKKILLRGFSGIDKNSKVFTWRINREGGKLQPYDLKRVAKKT